eukprot:975132_1
MTIHLLLTILLSLIHFGKSSIHCQNGEIGRCGRNFNDANTKCGTCCNFPQDCNDRHEGRRCFTYIDQTWCNTPTTTTTTTTQPTTTTTTTTLPPTTTTTLPPTTTTTTTTTPPPTTTTTTLAPTTTTTTCDSSMLGVDCEDNNGCPECMQCCSRRKQCEYP